MKGSMDQPSKLCLQDISRIYEVYFILRVILGPKMNYFLKLPTELAMQTRVTPKFSTLM